MIWTLILNASPAVQLAQDGKEKVVAVGVPLVALAVALLILTITILVIAYISGRLNDTNK